MIEPPANEWRLNPTTEKLFFESTSLYRRRVTLGFVVFAGIVLGPIGCLGAVMVSLVGEPTIGLWAGGGTVALFLLALVQYSRQSEDRHRRYLALHTEYAGSPGWLVGLTIHQGEAISGHDLGLVWFEEGRLYFTGARSSFGLAPGDVEPKIRSGYALLDGKADLVLSLVPEATTSPVSLSFQFQNPDSAFQNAEKGEAGFRREVRSWLGDRSSRGQLPPLTKGPGLPSLLSLRRRALLASGILVGLFGSLVACPFATSPFALLAFVGFCVLLVLWPVATMPFRCWKAVRDRQRLEFNTAGKR